MDYLYLILGLPGISTGSLFGIRKRRKSLSKRQFGKRVNKLKLIVVQLTHLTQKIVRFGSTDCYVGSGFERAGLHGGP